MSTWLSLVIGIILGLIVGWLIDMLWRRRPEAPEAAEDVAAPGRAAEWTIPPPAAPALETPEAPQAAELAVLPEASPAVELAVPPEAHAEEQAPVEELLAQVEPGEAATELGEPGRVDWPEISERVAQVADEIHEGPAEVRAETVELPETAPRLSSEALEALAPAPFEAPAAWAKDDLMRIEGIGRVYDGRLRAAGISTFAGLIDAGEARLQEIIQPQSWQRVNFAEWIEQARLIVEGKEEELRVLQEKLFRRKKA